MFKVLIHSYTKINLQTKFRQNYKMNEIQINSINVIDYFWWKKLPFAIKLCYPHLRRDLLGSWCLYYLSVSLWQDEWDPWPSTAKTSSLWSIPGFLISTSASLRRQDCLHCVQNKSRFSFSYFFYVAEFNENCWRSWSRKTYFHGRQTCLFHTNKCFWLLQVFRLNGRQKPPLDQCLQIP